MSTEGKDVKMHEPRLVITRTFDAPIARVWKAWTDPAMLAKWWGPKGFTAPVVTMDFRVGGKYHFCMRSADGQDFWSTGTYKEIVPLRKIVCSDSFADADGNVVPASYYGMKEDIPEELLITVEFTEENGKTTMTLTHLGLPLGEMSEMASTGWSEFFDKLVEALS